MQPHAFTQLKAYLQHQSSRTYNARGSAAKRCEHCLLSEATCICLWRTPQHCHIDFILLMHRNEVFKPTNTGKLIADIFPEHTHAFCWSRCEPAPALISLLADPTRQCAIAFPPNKDDIAIKRLYHHQQCDLLLMEKTLTIIFLDGTWKQASKMMRLSQWLQNVPIITLNVQTNATYSLRKAPQAHQLSTAEAASAALSATGQTVQAQVLQDYFSVFNTHYEAMRANRPPSTTAAHERLKANSNNEQSHYINATG